MLVNCAELVTISRTVLLTIILPACGDDLYALGRGINIMVLRNLFREMALDELFC
jgi:hypothetical protein